METKKLVAKNLVKYQLKSSVCVWSVSKKCMVGKNNITLFDILNFNTNKNNSYFNIYK